MSKLTTNWDALLASAPQNRQAAFFANGKGGAFVPRKQIIHERDVHTRNPIPTRPFGGGSKDLTGLKIGRLTVIGLAVQRPKSKKQKGCWVVRCLCGAFEIRKAKYLQNADPTRAECKECDHLHQMQLGQTGVEFPKITVRARP